MSTKASTEVNPTRKQENVDTSFLQNQVKAKIVVQDAKQKVQQKAVAQSFYLEYEQHKHSARAKSKDIKRQKAQRQGVDYQSSGDDEDAASAGNCNGQSYAGNFKAPPLSPATRKKRKMLAKKQKAKSFNDGDRVKNKSRPADDDSSDSSDDATPKVRYGQGDKSPRATFGGIKNMKSKSLSPSPPSASKKKTTANKKPAAKAAKAKGAKVQAAADDDEADSSPSPAHQKTTQKQVQNAEKEQPEFGVYDDTNYQINEIELDFSQALPLKTEVFCQQLPTPDGVTCGGETVMYDMDERGGEFFYLATDDEEEKVGIMRYDIALREWSKFADYPAEFSPDLHGNCIDIAGRVLYIFDRKQFGALDLRTKQWTAAMHVDRIGMSMRQMQSAQKHKLSDTVSKVANEYDPIDHLNQSPTSPVDGATLECQGLQSAYLPSPINEIHVFARTTIPPSTYHLLLDAERKYVVLGGFERDELLRGYKLCYSAAVRRLLVCGGQKQDEYGDGSWIDADHVWLCDVVSARQMRAGYNWRRLAVRLPYGGKTCGVVSVFGSIVVLIYLRDNERKEIYCLDLLQKEDDYKFVKSEKTFPFEGDCEYTDVVVTRQSNIHCMDFSNSVGHCVLNATHILPADMRLKYKQRFETMAVGFCRKNAEQKIFTKLSENIKRAIAVYLSQLSL